MTEVGQDREMLARWMIKNGFATGHGDTTADLLRELQWQIEELRADRHKRAKPVRLDTSTPLTTDTDVIINGKLIKANKP